MPINDTNCQSTSGFSVTEWKIFDPGDRHFQFNVNCSSQKLFSVREMDFRKFIKSITQWLCRIVMNTFILVCVNFVTLNQILVFMH